MHGMEMTTFWDYRLVALSIIIAIIGSFVALDFAGRMKSSQGRPRKLWFVGGALMMGLAIWSMHFIGMLALIMPMPVTYDEALMALSILAAATGSGIAFAIMNRQTLGRVHMISGSIAMGLAISTMHYTGMASMQMAAIIQYNPLLFILSIVIAVTASAAALWIAFRMRRDNPNVWFWQKVGSAVVMGCAISGMHYTAMAAAHYYHTGMGVSGIIPDPTVGSYRLSDLLIAASVLFGATLLLLMSQTAGERQRALQIAQRNLEREKLASDIVDSIRSESNLKTILEQAVQQLGRFTQADRCVIWLYNPEQGTFKEPYEYRSDQSIVSTLDTAFQDIPVLPNLSHTETFVFSDVLQEVPGLTDQDKQIIRERGIRSLLHVPILYKNNTLGILKIHAIKAKRQWDDETVSIVQNIAAQLAIALHNAKTLEALKDSEARKTAVLESSLDAVITIDEHATIVEWNPGAERIFGYAPAEIIGKNLSTTIIPERYREAHQKGIEHYLATGEGPVLGRLLELPALRKDGTEFPTELWIVPIHVKGKILFTSTLRDITERQKAREELEASNFLLNSISQIQAQFITEGDPWAFFDMVVQKVLSITESAFGYIGQVLYDESGNPYLAFLGLTNIAWSPETQKLYERMKTVGLEFHNMETIFGAGIKNGGSIIISNDPDNDPRRGGFPPGHPKVNAFMGLPLYAEGKLVGQLAVANRPGGYTEEMAKFLQPLLMTCGNIIQAYRNDQKRRQAEEEVKKLAEELEQRVIERTTQLQTVNNELESFSYSVSHDLRAPLRTIDGFSQAVLEMAYNKLDEREKNYLTRVREGSQQMAKLIDDILNLSRLTRGNLNIEENVNLSEIAQEIVTEFQKQEPERQVTVDIEPGIVVRGDRRLLQVVLQNMVGNSWKYTSKHATAHIVFGKLEEDNKTIYYVKDDGAGFDMAYADKLFGAFQRLHGVNEFTGTGVGLATVARIIHRHGGEVWAEGEVEKGATFYFTLEPIQLDKENTHAAEQQSYLAR